MAATKYQLGEVNKPNTRFILELHTIREMIQEADNVDKGLRAVLGILVRPTWIFLHHFPRVRKLSNVGRTEWRVGTGS
jgi:hypothetical protein